MLLSLPVTYYIVGIRPIKYIYHPETGLITAKKYEWSTGCFVSGEEYISEISFGDEVEEIHKEEFIQHVEKLRAFNVKADGELAMLYDEIRMIVSKQRAERPWKLTFEERQHIIQLTYRSYQLFESTIGCTICGHDEAYKLI
jgi:hypothetical protein